jgi:NitT/TauT family transport system ATP-binding protein
MPEGGTAVAAREIDARGVWKCFPQRNDQVVVLEEIDLKVEHGEFVCLVGPSGCGKSTLLSILAGLEEPTLGDVLIGGKPVRPGQGAQGFVFQQDLLLGWRTVLGNVLLGYSLRGQSTRPHAERARALLRQVGLHDTDHLYPWQLSGGMRQRVAICRALIDQPEVLFMDEPFGALDALTRERLNDDMIRLAGRDDRATTVVFVTHDVAEAVFLGDRVIVMGSRPGRIVREVKIRLPHRRPDVRATQEFARCTAEVRGALYLPQDEDGG